MSRIIKKTQNFDSKFDYRIVIVFVSVIILCTFYFLYKFIYAIDCGSADFYIVSKYNMVNEKVECYNETTRATKWEWDFGDKTKIANTKHATHFYKNAGTYAIKLTINGSCVKIKTITIKNPDDLLSSGEVPRILVPEVVKVGDPVKFTYEYASGNVYSVDWNFGETLDLDNVDQNPTYTYTTPGTKKITLIINNDVNNMAIQTIFVKPKVLFINNETVTTAKIKPRKLKMGVKQIDPAVEYRQYAIPYSPTFEKPTPPTPKVEVKKAPDISEEQFELLLHAVAKMSKTKEDFKDYLCSNYDIPVVKNNKQILTFTEFAKGLKEKTLKINALQLKKDPETNCIVSININYKVKKYYVWVED